MMSVFIAYAVSVSTLGYLPKDALREGLVRAVRAVASGYAWLHRRIFDWLRRRLRSSAR